MTVRAQIVAAWYRPRLTWLTLALTPFEALFATAVMLRRAAYRFGLLPIRRAGVPVIVVGNVTVGGAGKTPIVLALATALRARGFVPGVVSRGYGRAASIACVVAPDANARDVGDEPLLIARRGWPVAVGARRAEAALALLRAHPECNVLLADDGLQHYALARDVEIGVVDGARMFGNRHLLPAGPLREPAERLRETDAAIVLDAAQGVVSTLAARTFDAQLVPECFVNVADPSRTLAPAAFADSKAYAIAGIAHPEKFFATLRRLRVEVVARSFPDHHAFVPGDLPREAVLILMTEKDAVKCASFADARCWFLRVAAVVDSGLAEFVVAQLGRRAS